MREKGRLKERWKQQREGRRRGKRDGESNNVSGERIKEERWDSVNAKKKRLKRCKLKNWTKNQLLINSFQPMSFTGMSINFISDLI